MKDMSNPRPSQKIILFGILATMIAITRLPAEPVSPEVGPEKLYPAADLVIPTHTKWTRGHYPERIATFQQAPLEQGDIVFLGDSITEQGEDWASRFDVSMVKNRGISGDVTEGVVARLGEIIHSKPRAVFLMIGVNDLRNSGVKSAVVAKNIVQITEMIHRGSPATKIYVQSILPTDSMKLASKIRTINKLLIKRKPSSFTVIDLHPLFADSDDLMQKALTIDGVHLNPAGYALWAENVKEVVSAAAKDPAK